MTTPAISEAARMLASSMYEQIRQRFYSKLTCGPEKDEPWWDWLAVWLQRRVAEAEMRGVRKAEPPPAADPPFDGSITFARYIDKAFAEMRAKLHAAEERLRLQAEAVDRQNHDAFEAGRREGEEARRLAEQERDEAKAHIDECHAEETREDLLLAEVERLQGELAGLRKAAGALVTYWDKDDCEDVMGPLNDPESGERFEVMCELFDALRAALAPQEGAEGKGITE